jgi:hypothetical protein
MPIQARREYLRAIRERYRNSSKRQKTKILDEFCANCRYNRKYAIRILGGGVTPGGLRSRGAKPKYESVRRHLETLWEQMNRMCSKKMQAAFPLWLPYYKAATHPEKELLSKISPSTIDRVLRKFRTRSTGQGMTTTVPVLKHRIPIKLLDGEVTEPGFMEADTVSHCGGDPSGAFVSSLTMTDLCCGWTEIRALWTKKAEGVIEQVQSVEKDLPFLLQGFASDNGVEFLNEQLAEYFAARYPRVEFVRRRPFRKNDNAHVEQKNYTHVRALVGYERFDSEDLVSMLNEIYRVYWNPLCNYLTPVMKLVSKERVGSRIVKKYDKPKTPCQRLLDCEKIPKKIKKRLKEKLRSKNPFYLRAQLNKKLKLFFKRVEEIKKQREHTNAA